MTLAVYWILMLTMLSLPESVGMNSLSCLDVASDSKLPKCGASALEAKCGIAGVFEVLGIAGVLEVLMCV